MQLSNNRYLTRTLTVLIISSLLYSCKEEALPDFKPMYKEALYEVAEEQGRVYAIKVEGYWSTYPDTGEEFGTIYANRATELASTNELDLDMDLYYPVDTAKGARHPLLLLMHGGAFYNGDKHDIGFPEMGHHFAERGYVVASINYRLGFKPLAPDVDRAGYRAVQDAHAAVCYLIANADEFGIDTTCIFAAGTSAGAITALNLAFMREHNRPESTRKNGVKGWLATATETIVGLLGKGIHAIGSLFNKDWNLDGKNVCQQLGLDTDLGPINAVSGKNDRPFRVKAVVNMWGAVHDLAMLKNSPQTDILSFHGDADNIVPYGHGYPFNQVLDPYVEQFIEGLPGFMSGIAVWMRDWVTSGKPINEWAFNPMQGSKAIHDKATAMNMRSELHTAPGRGHSLHMGADGKSLCEYFYDTILPVMTRFLCEEMAGGQIVDLRLEPDNWFSVTGTDNVAEIYWGVEGGKISKKEGDYRVKVKFDTDAKQHSVTVCGKYNNGMEFRETLEK